jgi:hypothetical protein
MKYALLILAFGISSFSYSQTKKKTATTKKTTTKTTTAKSLTTTKSATPTSTSKTTSILSKATSALSVNSLSEADISKGLKDALTIGANNASKQLNVLDGFNKNNLIRIPFPAEVSQVATKLRDLGMGGKVDEFEVTLNRAAEQAAKDAAPIFANAISQMSIIDAKNILTGSNNAATTYLQGKTTDALVTAFSPTIKSALGSNLATSKWTEITSIYNKLPFITAVETDLTKYTTNKALSGLFTVLADEEKKIRENPAARTTDILQKVFGSIK